MKISENSKPIPALILFAIGILSGLIFSVLAIWADYESSSYGFLKRATTQLKGLSCPILMNREETGTIKLKITNIMDRKISPSVRVETSTRLELTSEIESFELEPGESRTLTWTVNSENIDLKQFIFTKALIYSAYPMPDQENTCGIFIVSTPLKGIWITAFLLITSLLCTGYGSFILYKNKPQLKQISQLLFIAGTCLLLLINSFVGSWIFSVVLLVLLLLLIIITIGAFTTGE
jgi:hypothetical protein